MHPGGNTLARVRCLLAQPCRQRQLAGITLVPGGQFGPTPPQAAEFFANNALRLRFGRLAAQLARMGLAAPAFHFLQHLALELLAAQTPAPAKPLPGLRVRRRQPARLHPPLKLLPPRRRLLLQAMLSQQPVHSHPGRSVLRGRQVSRPATPRMSPPAPLGIQDARSHRVEMHVIACRAQVTIAAAFHPLRLVPPAAHLPEKPVTVLETYGVGALQPSHAGDQVSIGRHHYHVIVVAYQAIRMNQPASLLTRLGQRLEKVLPVHVIEVDVFVAIPTTHHMAALHWIFDLQLARHEAIRCYPAPVVNS